MTDIGIIGGGASGIMSAISAKEHNPNATVYVFERSPKCLKKLLSTGNGRCNLLNMDAKEENYHGEDTEDAFKIIKKAPPEFMYDFFEGLGLKLSKRFFPLIYPNSFQASSVREALLTAAYDRGVKILTDFEIVNVKKEDGLFILTNKKGKTEKVKKLIISGGTSATSGSDSALDFLKVFSHKVYPYYPALTPLVVKEDVKVADGARAFATLTLYDKDKIVKKDSGEIQFTDYGISGIVTMQLSGECLNMINKGLSPIISVSFFEEAERDYLINALKAAKKKWANKPCLSALSFIINSSVAKLVLAFLKISESMLFSDLSEWEIEKIADTLLDLKLTPVCSKGEKFSQVFGGGASLSCFDNNLNSKITDGLYATGEVLDIYGDCGGYNLTWAWATGYIAGKHAAESSEG